MLSTMNVNKNITGYIADRKRKKNDHFYIKKKLTQFYDIDGITALLRATNGACKTNFVLLRWVACVIHMEKIEVDGHFLCSSVLQNFHVDRTLLICDFFLLLGNVTEMRIPNCVTVTCRFTVGS